MRAPPGPGRSGPQGGRRERGREKPEELAEPDWNPGWSRGACPARTRNRPGAVGCPAGRRPRAGRGAGPQHRDRAPRDRARPGRAHPGPEPGDWARDPAHRSAGRAQAGAGRSAPPAPNGTKTKTSTLSPGLTWPWTPGRRPRRVSGRRPVSGLLMPPAPPADLVPGPAPAHRLARVSGTRTTAPCRWGTGGAHPGNKSARRPPRRPWRVRHALVARTMTPLPPGAAANDGCGAGRPRNAAPRSRRRRCRRRPGHGADGRGRAGHDGQPAR